MQDWKLKVITICIEIGSTKVETKMCDSPLLKMAGSSHKEYVKNLANPDPFVLTIDVIEWLWPHSPAWAQERQHMHSPCAYVLLANSYIVSGMPGKMWTRFTHSNSCRLSAFLLSSDLHRIMQWGQVLPEHVVGSGSKKKLSLGTCDFHIYQMVMDLDCLELGL